MESEKSNVVQINDPQFKEPIKFYLDPRLRKDLDKVKLSLEEKDKDFVMCVDGSEGGGKSTMAFSIGKYMDPTLNLDRIVFDAEQFKEAIFKAKKDQCVVFDEAFTGLSSRASLSAVNKALVGLLMQIRQLNLFIIIVLPSFFLLDKYVALWRTRALIHVYEGKGGRRGYFLVYNRRLKKLLYLFGKQFYSYSPKIGTKERLYTGFKGRFYGVFALGDKETERKYREKKLKCLRDIEKKPISLSEVKHTQERNVFCYIIRKKLELSYRNMQELFKEYNIDLSYVQISNICKKFEQKEYLETLEEGKEMLSMENKQEDEEY